MIEDQDTRPTLNTLGTTAKVELLADTIRRSEMPLDKRARDKLRLEKLKELIRSKPYGTVLLSQEIQRVLGIKSTSQTSTYLANLVAKGIIHREGHKYQYTYSVPEIQKVIRPATPPVIQQEVEAPVAEKPIAFTLSPPPESMQGQINRLAQQYVWEWPERDNVRDFMKYLEHRL